MLYMRLELLQNKTNRLNNRLYETRTTTDKTNRLNNALYETRTTTKQD